MLNAAETRKIADAAKTTARESEIFKIAIKNLENDIKQAASRGKHEICFNICYFDIRPFSSLKNDVYATSAERNAICEYMIENGYEFFFHNVLNIAGRINNCFTCRW